jgi:hypothetical protein
MRFLPMVLPLPLLSCPGCREPGPPPERVLECPPSLDLPAGERDLAIACLVTGTCEPPFESLEVGCQDELLELVGRTLHAYGAAAFPSFLALRRRDLGHARWIRAGDVVAILEQARSLGVAVSGEEDWLGALEAFWYAYYPRPPVARWLPERSAVNLGARPEPDEAALVAWELEYERRMVAVELPTVEAALAVPHRRGVLQGLGPSGELRWIDVDLAFESSSGEPMRLWLRFVRDEVGEEWFLHRATTFYPPDSRGTCNLVL